jgi:hypothetical protein
MKRALAGLLIGGVALGTRAAAPIEVRFAEGVEHAFLLLRSVDGALLATGDVLQIVRDGAVDKRMVFQFTDGSVFEESVVFTDLDVYSMLSYRLLQRGPVFSEDIEISLERATGQYHVTTTAHEDGEEKTFEGVLDLPSDVYNGMILTIVKDLPAGAGETVHYVIFTPHPRIIRLEIEPAGEQTVFAGELTKTAVHYVLKPRPGMWLKLFAKLSGRMPPHQHVWLVPDEVPAFVRFEGPLYPTGPVWLIELTSPRWPGRGLAEASHMAGAVGSDRAAARPADRADGRPQPPE